MKACSYCGRENTDSATSCRECGKDEFGSPARVPGLPITFSEQSWIEASFLCLIGEYGKDPFLSPRTILPEQSFSPDKYRGAEECVRKVAARVCSCMDV